MPIQIDWYDSKQTIVHFQMSDPWGWPDFFHAMEQMRPAQESVPYKVVWVFDMRQSKTLPKDVFNQTKLISKKRPPNTHPVYLILNGDMLMKSLSNIFMRLFGDTYGTYLHFITEFAEAETTALAINASNKHVRTN